jgi:hypothetical protein
MEWIVIPLIILGGVLGLYLSERRERRYLNELVSREPLCDDELADRYFTGQAVPRDVPGRVRWVMAEPMGYPAAHMLPDDDLSFFWGEFDGVELTSRLEKEFGISITSEDLSLLQGCTIRAFTDLILRKTKASQPFIRWNG